MSMRLLSVSVALIICSGCEAPTTSQTDQFVESPLPLDEGVSDMRVEDAVVDLDEGSLSDEFVESDLAVMDLGQVDQELMDEGLITEMPDQMVDVNCNDIPRPTECDPTCDNQADCLLEVCEYAEYCQPCLEGGNCLFTGELTLVGSVLSERREAISNITITSKCNEVTNQYEPDPDGDFSFTQDVNGCEELLIRVERTGVTSGFVPEIYRYAMPPALNTIELNVRLREADTIRCDGVACASDSFDSPAPDDGSYASGYAYHSIRVNEMNDRFGSVFRSDQNELLWLQRYAYREYRDAEAQVVPRLPERDQMICSRLNDDTRSWVADLSSLISVPDYHQRQYSLYADDDERWAEYEADLTDPAIDPDGDGSYEGIEMLSYQLDFTTGRWTPLLNSSGQMQPSRILAQIEEVMMSRIIQFFTIG